MIQLPGVGEGKEEKQECQLTFLLLMINQAKAVNRWTLDSTTISNVSLGDVAIVYRQKN